MRAIKKIIMLGRSTSSSDVEGEGGGLEGGEGGGSSSPISDRCVCVWFKLQGLGFESFQSLSRATCPCVCCQG